MSMKKLALLVPSLLLVACGDNLDRTGLDVEPDPDAPPVEPPPTPA